MRIAVIGIKLQNEVRETRGMAFSVIPLVVFLTRHGPEILIMIGVIGLSLYLVEDVDQIDLQNEDVASQVLNQLVANDMIKQDAQVFKTDYETWMNARIAAAELENGDYTSEIQEPQLPPTPLVSLPDWIQDMITLDLPTLPEGADLADLRDYNLYEESERDYYWDIFKEPEPKPLPPTPPVEPFSDFNHVDISIPTPEPQQPYPFPMPDPPIPFPQPEPNTPMPDPTPNDPDGLPGTGIPGVFIPPGFDADPDPDAKGGGKDPIVLHDGFGYFEFDAYKCSNASNSFDYDSDGFPEHMCYWYVPTTKIFFNDKYDNQTLIDGSQFLGDYTHLWQDKNSNVFIDDGELVPIESHNINIVQKSKNGWKDYDSGRYVYCAGGSDFGNVVCTYPTYWQTQEWMKDR